MKPTTIRCIALIYFAISILVGCKNHTSTLQMGLGSSKQSNETVDTRSHSSEATQNKHFGVVLLHGCMGTENELDLFASALDDKFGDDVIIIQPTCRAGFKSVKCSIKDQAKKVFEEIKSLLGTQANSFPLFVIGYSQGGLVACVLGDQYKDKLNIYGIVTWNTPLRGVPALNHNVTDIEKFMNNAQDGLQLIPSCSSPNDIQNHMRSLTEWLIRARWPMVRFNPGLQQMLPNNSFLQNIYSFIREGEHNIPISLIAGYEDNVSNLFAPNDIVNQNESLKQLNLAISELITNVVNGKNDTLIPLKSQLCRGPSFDDLTIRTNETDPIHETMPGKDNVQYHIFSGVTHSAGSPVLGLDVSEENIYKVTIYNNQVHSYIIKFIQGRFSDPNKQT